MQVAHSSSATEAKVDCQVAKEVWQAPVWLSQWRSNLWPVLLPSLYACSGKLMWLDLLFTTPHPPPPLPPGLRGDVLTRPTWTSSSVWLACYITLPASHPWCHCEMYIVCTVYLRVCAVLGVSWHSQFLHPCFASSGLHLAEWMLLYSKVCILRLSGSVCGMRPQLSGVD